jgi:hypothetical protein
MSKRLVAAILLAAALTGCISENPELRQHHGKIHLKNKPKGAPDPPEWCFEVQHKKLVFNCRWNTFLHQWVPD